MMETAITHYAITCVGFALGFLCCALFTAGKIADLTDALERLR